MKLQGKYISYALYGYNTERKADSLDWKTYMRGLEVNIRIAKLLYPEYRIYVALDKETYNSKYQELFDKHKEHGFIEFEVFDRRPSCEMMLWRMRPIYLGADRVLCRDTDSLLCYKEAQIVKYWENNGRLVLAITDSISHNIELMGGLCGFICNEFRRVTSTDSFRELIGLGHGIDFSVKGSDQLFLKQQILTRVHHSMTEFYLLGMPQSFRGDCHRDPPQIDLGFPEEFKETNGYAFHLGASGYQESHVVKFLEKWGTSNEYFNEVESKFPELFYWTL